MNLTVHKVAACRFDYEYLGRSIDELARMYNFPKDSIEMEIEESEWVRKIEPTALPDTKDVEKFASDLESITRSKLSIISLFRQIDNQPLIAQLEKVFLEKALELAASLNPQDDKASNKLTNLVKAVTILQDRNPIDLANQFKEAVNGSGKVVVNIANQLH